ncbi:UNKNOWN [Stylonychia lemnae]|uniref:Uncharacterized protein n=1 Tax=Stylonychia lemnae TaxID=5949 RepID=A0A078AD93_STYLE|nr:UNKNOWN [Stylonychia lemnae]|eukprot:CDW79811.1 UNKNOWN [Stylonychia lemnae]
MNAFFLAQIVQGLKNYVRRDAVKISSVPHIETLTTKHFLQIAKLNQVMLTYLPDERDWDRIDRQWLCDIFYTLEQEQMQQMIDEALSERMTKQIKRENLQVTIRPEFAAAFEKCKGKACSMLKDSAKRRRSQLEREEIKDEEQLFKQDKYSYLQEVKRLKKESTDINNDTVLMRDPIEAGSISSMNQSQSYQMLDQSIRQAQLQPIMAVQSCQVQLLMRLGVRQNQWQLIIPACCYSKTNAHPLNNLLQKHSLLLIVRFEAIICRCTI